MGLNSQRCYMIDGPIGPPRATILVPCFNLIAMKLHSILVVLLCCVFGLLHASVSDLEDLSHNINASDPSVPLVMLPVTSDSTGLCSRRVWTFFLAELILEMSSLGVIAIAVTAQFACSLPTLLTGALSLITALYVMEMGLTILRTKLICDSASAAPDLGCRAPALQTIVSSASVANDISRALPVLLTVIQSHYCETGAHTMTSSLSAILLFTVVMSILQLLMLLGNMGVWLRDTQEPLPAGAFQE